MNPSFYHVMETHGFLPFNLLSGEKKFPYSFFLWDEVRHVVDAEKPAMPGVLMS